MIQHILFVNACMRGREESRTWQLSQAFLAACKARWPKAEILERDLTVCDLPVLTGPMTVALKIYLEWASVLGITFHYTLEGKQEGLCKAGNLVYITTSGGEIGDKNLGFDYIEGLCGMFGISRAHCLTAEGLDVWDNDTQAILNRAKKQAEKLAASL